MNPCTGYNCPKKEQCKRYDNNNKIFRLKSTRCLAQDFDLFVPKGKQDEQR